MANDKKFVVKKGLVAPNVDFANGGTISATYLSSSNTLSFSGNTGQLFSITDSMSGTIFSVNDISGIPSIEVIDTGAVKIAETFGTVAIGANTVSGYKLYVNGNTLFGNSVTLNSTLIANGSVGTSGFVLTSNGTGVYWAAANSAIASVATANNSTYAYGKQESQLSVNNAVYLAGRTWQSPSAIGSTVANTGAFTSVTTNGNIQQQNANYLSGRNSSGTATRLFGVNSANTLYIGGIDVALGTTLFVNNGVEQMRIDTSGNVAIGSSSAPTKLFVNGHMSIANGFGIYANGVLGANGLVLTSNGTSLYWGSVSSSGGGFTGNTVSANATIVKDQSYYVNAAAGWVTMSLPSTVDTGDIFIVHSQTGNTRILNNSINIMDVGSGNDLVLESGDTVWLQAVNTSAVGVMFTYPAGGTPAVVGNSSFSTTANNSIYAYGKQESQLSVANAVYTQTSNNATYAYGKQEGQLSVANAVFATTANNALRFNGKQESQLSVANAVFADTANNALRFNGKQEAQLSVANAVYAQSAGSVAGGSVSGTVATANNATYAYGKQESQLSVANSVFAQSANNADYLDGFHASYFTNATNISTGTLAEPRLPYRLNQDLRTTDSVTFANLTITGSVTVTGNVTSWSANNLQITDNMIYLNANSQVANPDLGFTGNYNDGTYRHAGFFRDATDGVWKVFDQYLPEPDASPYIDTSNSSFRIANFQANVVTIASANVGGTLLTSTTYGGTANNSTYSYGKQEAQLSVANAVYAQSAGSVLGGNVSGTVANANNATYAYGKQESQLSVAAAANATFATTANNALRLNGKQESQLSVAIAANATFADTANNSLRLNGKQESQLSVANAVYAQSAGSVLGGNVSGTVANANNSTYLDGRTWASPFAIGSTVANTGAFTTLSATGAFTSTSGGTNISLNGATANRIVWNINGVAAPTFTTYSAGTKLVLYDSIGGANAGYAMGIETSTMWFSVGDTSNGYKWYGGTTNFMSANTTALYHTGNITAYSSDRRLKKNITPIEEPVKKIQQIGGYTFDWDRELCEKYEFIPGQTHEHGVIAQEIEKIIPDAVTRAPFDIGKDGESKTGENYLTVRYDRIVPLLIEAVKEQQKEIDTLKELVKTLINKEQDNG